MTFRSCNYPNNRHAHAVSLCFKRRIFLRSGMFYRKYLNDRIEAGLASARASRTEPVALPAGRELNLIKTDPPISNYNPQRSKRNEWNSTHRRMTDGDASPNRTGQRTRSIQYYARFSDSRSRDAAFQLSHLASFTFLFVSNTTRAS